MNMKTNQSIRTVLIVVMMISLLFLTGNPNPSNQGSVSNWSNQASTVSAYHGRFHPGTVRKKVISSSPKLETPPKASLKEIQSTYLTFQESIYRRKIELRFANNKIVSKNHIISIKLNTFEMMKETKLPFSKDQLYFTLADGKTRIPHRIESGFGKLDTKYWLQLPEIDSSRTTILFVVFGPGVSATGSPSKPFAPSEPSLLSFYYFDDAVSEDIFDISHPQQQAKFVNLTYQSDFRWGMSSEPMKRDRSFPVMYNWKNSYSDDGEDDSTYLVLPLPLSNPLHQSGSLEVNINRYDISEPITQVLFTDQSHQMVFGLLPDRKPYFQLGGKFNRIVWHTSLQSDRWYRLVLTWDLVHHEVLLFINEKKETLLPSKSVLQFASIKPISAILLGGVPGFSEEYGYNGLIEYVRLYNKAITLPEIIISQRQQQEKNRFPDLQLGKTELIQLGKNKQYWINLLSTQSIPVTEKMKINLIYCNPVNDYHQYDSTLIDPIDPSINTIDRLSKEAVPVFGMNSHFWSNVGTSAKISENHMVYFVGLKVNNPSYIKDLSLEFKWIASYDDKEYANNWYRENYFQGQNEEEDEETETGWLDWLIPSAKACGPFYSFFQLGKSKLKLIGIADGISWYQLEQPIYVNPSISVMQLSYHHTNVLGYLTIQLTDMLCLNENRQLFRVKLLNENNDNFVQKLGGKDEIVISPEYKAKLLVTEKGTLTFQQNEDLGMDMVFQNTGIDPIIFDKNTVHYFENNLFYGLSVYTLQEKLIVDTTIHEILEPVLGLTIQPGEALFYPFLYSFDLDKDTTYKIVVYEGSPNFDIAHYDKIISWAIGDNPFDEFYYYDTTIIQKFWVNSKGKIQFSTQVKHEE